jgi:hypothetical protein
MVKMISRILFVLKYEGITGFIAHLKNRLLLISGIRISETLFYRNDLATETDISENKINESLLENIKILQIKQERDLQAYKPFPKQLYSIPMVEWFSRGALCIIIAVESRIIAYTWIHFNFYDSLGLPGTIYLGKGEVFIGPFYTDISYRGKGLYYHLMQNSLLYLKKQGINYVYSASTSENIATIKVCVRSGFDVIGSVKARSDKNKFILEYNRENLLSSRLNRH